VLSLTADGGTAVTGIPEGMATGGGGGAGEQKITQTKVGRGLRTGGKWLMNNKYALQTNTQMSSFVVDVRQSSFQILFF